MIKINLMANAMRIEFRTNMFSYTEHRTSPNMLVNINDKKLGTICLKKKPNDFWNPFDTKK